MRKVLFLAHRIPFPPDRGDKIRSHHLLKGLASHAEVHVATFAETEADRAQEANLAQVAASHHLAQRDKALPIAGLQALASGKPVSLTAFDDRALRLWIKDTIAQQSIEAIFVFSGQMGQYVPDDFEGRVIIDLCDVDSAKFADYAAEAGGPKAWLYGREDRLLAREEARLARRADSTLLITDQEADLLRSRIDAAHALPISSLGNGIDAKLFDPSKVEPHPELTSEEGPHFVFTGQMDYLPNHNAAFWVIEELMTPLRAIWPTAQFHVVGRAPLPKMTAYDGENGVRVWGEVPDVRPFLAGADIVLTPLTIARGVQNKVLEAMAMERPVLLTPEAATGIGAANGEDFIVERANTRAMLLQIEKLMSDADLRVNIGTSARKFVTKNMSWQAVYGALGKLLDPEGGIADAPSSKRATVSRQASRDAA
jgi:sugar transferase (PEP-CTERM/EpsH1 system associated)